MNKPGHLSKASYLPCSTQSASQPGRRRARSQLTKLATTSSCLLLLLCHRQREHLVHGLVVPSHGSVARSTFSRTSGVSGSSASTAGGSPRWDGRYPRPKHGLEMTLTSPPARTQQQQETETINGGTQSVREMSAQMSQMRKDLEDNEEAQAYMQALRGAGIRDYASAEGEMRLLEIEDGEAEGAGGETDRLPLVYDPEALKDYFARRPQVATRRTLQLAGAFSGFVTSYLLDLARGKVKENEIARAIQLREIITSLGPFYIKLGQALSIRPDILSPGAMVELQRLCDKVPSFDSTIAFLTMELEYGRPVEEIFVDITPEPLAAASLGQRTDLVALLDEFASRFFDELDYVKECANGVAIRDQMQHIKQVVVPFNYPEFTTRRVFVSEWIDGEKLSQSKADDVQDLVNVGVTAYLTQLLDTGFFHADPHPGNLIRTPDGKLAILDFGLMTQITDNQKFGMIEAISHLVHRDYEGIGDDFKRLDFIPEEVDVTPIIPALTNVFNMALAGGGAKSINFQALASDLAQITFDYPFRIPPYFALIIRAIGVLEGIALVGNPGFAIVDEAYPYISKRLLTDDSPRLREALRYMIYGKSNVFDVERLIDLLQALESFQAKGDTTTPTQQTGAALATTTLAAPATAAAGGGPGPGRVAAVTTPSSDAREALRFLFGKDGEFFREFLLDEVVKGADCLGRDAARELAFTVGLRGSNVPNLLRAVTPKLSDEDRKVVDNTNKLLAFLLGNLQDESQTKQRQTPVNPAQGLFGLRVATPPFNLLGLGTSARGTALREELTPVIRELGPEMREFGLQVVGRLTEKLATRVLRYTSGRVLNNYYNDGGGGEGSRGTSRGGAGGQYGARASPAAAGGGAGAATSSSFSTRGNGVSSPGRVARPGGRKFGEGL
ncbi:unnamed protein product [Ectocarpus sp. 6 AP-2014]